MGAAGREGRVPKKGARGSGEKSVEFRQAEEIARMAQYILDSEIKADEKVQNDFYQMINEELALTEEEFEKLF